MNFNTALFLFLFLPFFLLPYFIAQPRWRPLLGIIASLLFYAWGDAVNLILIFGLILLNYWLGLQLGAKSPKWALPFGLLVNIWVLFAFKWFIVYGERVIPVFAEYLPERISNWLGSLTFPLGLSYISFQLISYLIDVHKGIVRSEKSLLSFTFYILLFPKLLVGPIVRYHALAEQLLTPTLEANQVADGIRRFLRGFAKKILIADTLAKVVNAIFSLPVGATTPETGWLGLIGYALQIYYDFSGYTDMAIGLASMMGLQFTENFNNPYMAQSIGDFWRRWHISLSSWFREYIFYPLERMRIPFLGQSFSILIVFVLTGLWHGFAVEFVIWGLLHGFFVMIESLFLNRWLQATFRPIRHVYTLAVILITWLIFRAPNLEYAGDFLLFLLGKRHEIFQLSFTETSPLPFIEPTFIMAFVAGILLALPIGSVIQSRAAKSFPLSVATDLFLLALFVLSVGVMISNQFLPGIYESF
jgi:alginate O-acetyltransferase complex protein AlgI